MNSQLSERGGDEGCDTQSETSSLDPSTTAAVLTYYAAEVYGACHDERAAGFTWATTEGLTEKRTRRMPGTVQTNRKYRGRT